jgi:NADH:ubiquinone oxidoreductase subunit B-like Fe-S oxidoreductase
MIDFTTSQLTWIVVGACSLGGGGYLTMTSTVGDLDKKIEVSNARAEAMNEKLSSLKSQLDRIEDKIDSGRK